MTKEQTRQMGIEFERRLQTMYPQAELLQKIDTDTIYSFLSEYCIQYVKNMVMMSDQLKDIAKKKYADVIKPITITEEISLVLQGLNTIANLDLGCDLPSECFMYVKSASIINSSYKGSHNNKHISNIYVDQESIDNLSSVYYDENKIIRNPLVTISGDKLYLIKDKYTDIEAIVLTYIRLPKSFNIINNNEDVLDHCELPYSCFDELVSGALQLYMTYKTNVDLMNNEAKKKALKNLTGDKEDKE